MISEKLNFCSVIMCMCNFVWKGHPRNDLYCVGWDVKPYSHSLSEKWQLIGDWLLVCRGTCLNLVFMVRFRSAIDRGRQS